MIVILRLNFPLLAEFGNTWPRGFGSPPPCPRWHRPPPYHQRRQCRRQCRRCQRRRHQTVSILPSSAGKTWSRDASAGSAPAIPMVAARIPDAVSSDVTNSRRSMISFSGRKRATREDKCDSRACQLPPRKCRASYDRGLFSTRNSVIVAGAVEPAFSLRRPGADMTDQLSGSEFRQGDQQSIRDVHRMAGRTTAAGRAGTVIHRRRHQLPRIARSTFKFPSLLRFARRMAAFNSPPKMKMEAIM